MMTETYKETGDVELKDRIFAGIINSQNLDVNVYCANNVRKMQMDANCAPFTIYSLVQQKNLKYGIVFLHSKYKRWQQWLELNSVNFADHQ